MKKTVNTLSVSFSSVLSPPFFCPILSIVLSPLITPSLSSGLPALQSSPLLSCPLCPWKMHLWALCCGFLEGGCFSLVECQIQWQPLWGFSHLGKETHTMLHIYTHTERTDCFLLSPYLFLHQAALRGCLTSALVSKHRLALSTSLTLLPHTLLCFFLSLSLKSSLLLCFPAFNCSGYQHSFLHSRPPQSLFLPS